MEVVPRGVNGWDFFSVFTDSIALATRFSASFLMCSLLYSCIAFGRYLTIPFVEKHAVVITFGGRDCNLANRHDGDDNDGIRLLSTEVMILGDAVVLGSLSKGNVIAICGWVKWLPCVVRYWVIILWEYRHGKSRKEGRRQKERRQGHCLIDTFFLPSYYLYE